MMTITLSENLDLASSCMQIAKKFSELDLRAHPSTDRVMSCFSDNARFTGRCFGAIFPFNVGKRVAEFGFKYLCEDKVDFIELTSEVTFEEKSDHIVWSFKSVQLRRGVLASWLKAPQWYKINGVSNLYFEHTKDGVKISRYENLVNEWTPCEKPENV